MEKPKIIIFDVGGTLVKTFDGSIEAGYKYLYDEILEVKESFEEFYNFINSLFPLIKQRDNTDLEFCFESFFNLITIIYKKKSLLSFKEIERKFIKSFYKPEIIDYAEVLLKKLSDAKIPLYVLSNSMYSSNEIKEELGVINIAKYFKEIISSGDHLLRKPSLDLFKICLKKFDIMGYKPSDICYIGNSEYFDIEPTKSLGMMSILLGNEYIQHEDYLEIDSYERLIEKWNLK